MVQEAGDFSSDDIAQKYPEEVRQVKDYYAAVTEITYEPENCPLFKEDGNQVFVNFMQIFSNRL